MGSLDDLSAHEAGVQVEHWLSDAYLKGWNDASQAASDNRTDAWSQLAIDELNRIEQDWARLSGEYANSSTVVPVKEVRVAINRIVTAMKEDEWDPRRTEQRG